ncbi:hypothetical protein Tco_1033427 [Tanacetum coccineum]
MPFNSWFSSLEESPSGLVKVFGDVQDQHLHSLLYYGAGLLFAYLAFIQGHDLQTVESIPLVVNGVEKDLNIVKESTIHCDAVNLQNRDAIDLTL